MKRACAGKGLRACCGTDGHGSGSRRNDRCSVNCRNGVGDVSAYKSSSSHNSHNSHNDRNAAPSAPRCIGATLIELLVALLVGIILLGAALPSYQALLQHQRLRAAVEDLFAAIDLTRSQAIARGGRVLMIPADPAGAAWERGWLVFVDRNGNGRHDANEELIYQQGPVADGIVIRAAFSSATSSGYLAYNAAGRSCTADNTLAARFGTLSLVQGKATRNIKINMLGRVRLCDPQLQASACGSAADP